MTLDAFEQMLSAAEAPEIERTADQYREKFHSRYGQAWVFAYSYRTDTAIVEGSDIDWQEYKVVNGQAMDRLMNEEEIQWLRQAWRRATEQIHTYTAFRLKSGFSRASRIPGKGQAPYLNFRNRNSPIPKRSKSRSVSHSRAICSKARRVERFPRILPPNPAPTSPTHQSQKLFLLNAPGG
jgi:hypothetical protein